MRQETADLVYPVVLRALGLRDRLGRGEAPDFEAEQAALRGMLQPEVEARRQRAYGSDPGPEDGGEAPGPLRPLGVRYLLACWLDEFFIGFTPWAERWKEKKLETALYGTNERAWRPWEEARLAERRGDADALEAFFLAEALGFRGDALQDPAQLRAWAATAHARHGRLSPWKAPAEREPPTAVPPLRGRTRLRRAVLAAGLLLLLLTPLAAFFIAKQLGQ